MSQILGLYWDYIGIMEKNMEKTILALYRDNGKKTGNYYSMLGLYWDHGRENGNYYNGVI